jgi:hypothetical protein
LRVVFVLSPLQIVAIGAIGIAIAILRWFFGNRRSKALKEVAHQLGLTFEGEDWSHTNNAPQLETPLFACGANGEVQNIITGRCAGLDCSFFDYGYGVRRGSTHQTVAAFSQDVWFPQFEIAPQDVLHRMGDVILHKEIHFESNPGLSRLFRVLSVDEEKVRELFAPALLSFIEGIEERPKWHLEGSGRTLIIYRRGRKAEPGEFPKFVQDTTEMAKTFFSVSRLK